MKNKLRKNTARERAWKLMRTMKTYTLTDIATLAEADYDNVSHYHQCLVKAGYVRQVGTRRQEGRPGIDKIYRLIRNTGSKPPTQKGLRFLYDFNTGEYWSEDPERIAAIMAASRELPLAGKEEGITGKLKLGSGVKMLCPKKRGRRALD
jgi:predicted transcriptional regulator